MNRDDSVYLLHIVDAIECLQNYLDGMDKDTFMETRLVQDGVIRQLEIIGEAVKHLSPDVRGQYPDIPWRDIAGMRDKLIHHYFGVDLEAVWLTAQEDTPLLLAVVARILRTLQGDSETA